MKVEITKAQLNAFMEMTDEFSAMLGTADDDRERNKWVRLADRFFNKNGYKRNFK